MNLQIANMIQLGRLFDRVDHRYSLANTLRGGKLSLQHMNRTRSLKLQKVKDAKSAHPHFQFNAQPVDSSYQSAKQEMIFMTTSRILKGRPSEKRKNSRVSAQLMVQPSQSQNQQFPSPKQTFIHFQSANLNQKMNLYLNNLLNKSSEEHKMKLKEIQTKINPLFPQPKQAANTQNIFWRKMRRYKRTKQDKAGQSA